MPSETVHEVRFVTLGKSRIFSAYSHTKFNLSQQCDSRESTANVTSHGQVVTVVKFQLEVCRPKFSRCWPTSQRKPSLYRYSLPDNDVHSF